MRKVKVKKVKGFYIPFFGMKPEYEYVYYRHVSLNDNHQIPRKYRNKDIIFGISSLSKDFARTRAVYVLKKEYSYYVIIDRLTHSLKKREFNISDYSPKNAKTTRKKAV